MRVALVSLVLASTSACVATRDSDLTIPFSPTDAGADSPPIAGDSGVASDPGVATANATASTDTPIAITIASTVSIYPGASTQAQFALVRNGNHARVTQYQVANIPEGITIDSIADGVITFESDPFAPPSSSTLTIEALGANVNDVVAQAPFTLTITNPTFTEAPMQALGFVPAMSVQASALARAADGSLFMLGAPFQTAQTCEVVRHFADGSFDLAFGAGGVTDVALPLNLPHPRAPQCAAIALTDRGASLVAGTTGATAFVFRLTPAGILDVQFGARDPQFFPNGGGRIFSADAGLGISAIAVDSAHGIWLAGDSGGASLYLNHLRSDGSDDPAFTAPSAALVGTSLVQTSDGNVYVGGASGALLRASSAGAIDTTFGTNGIAPLPWTSPGEPAVTSLAIDQAGNVVIAGTAQDVCAANQAGGTQAAAASQAAFVAKLLAPSGVFDATFGARVSACATTAAAITIDSQNRILVSGTQVLEGGIVYNEPFAYLLDDSGNTLRGFSFPDMGHGLQSVSGPFFSLAVVNGATAESGDFQFLMQSETSWSPLVQMSK